MDSMRARARELMPQVLLTVLSIIQALALEVLWSSVHETDHLWQGGFPAFLGWLQVLAVFQGILVMWLFYVSLVLRYRWTPTVADSVVPFLLGVLEFSMAEMLEPELMHLWCFVLAAIFAGASTTGAVILRHAASDPENRDSGLGTVFSMRRSLGQAASLVGTLLVAGAAVLVWGPAGWVALLAVVAANVVLVVQAGIIRHYWVRSLGIASR